MLSFEKGKDVIKYALKGSGGWIGWEVGKLEAERLVRQQLQESGEDIKLAWTTWWQFIWGR